ncbi:hypothetical protein CC1G_08080 [Coprinopsis cinerea okayama7|uniref:F-box domain-containing protein n=1 Tax=Coprinopsis cinerea (strain Okayama-7 / 130 / ATCC MYA-4618 / FGSC 9003) TaxID=240176 RepID=A8NVP1_COPC7|nr:hypothetical protein CC1G_08080 [Coprinopsis cinerea okayama7\|eukprot:XP_001836695.1 hypothetical protein CC1G_08080 [Coprinopsis cinerea okayama7\
MARVPQEPLPYQDPAITPYYPSTNNGLPSELIPQCIAHLSKMDGIVATAKKEVFRLQAELDEARRQLQHALDEQASCDSLLAPIRRVPSELLSSIFMIVLDCPRLLSTRDVIQIQYLQLVCRKWHDAVNSTHELWAGLEFDVESPRRAFMTPEEKRALLERWFERAGGCGISLKLGGMHRLGMTGVQETMDEELTLRGLLLRPGRRWKSLSFIYPRSSWIKVLLSALEKEATYSHCSWRELEELDIQFRPSQDARSEEIIQLSRLKNLKRLTLSWMSHPFVAHATLQRLHLKGFRLDHGALVHILALLPSLQELELTSPQYTTRHLPPWRPADEANLAKVSVSKFCLSNTNRPLELFQPNFRLPRMQSCRFVTVSPMLWDRGILSGFFNRSPDLQEIDFTESMVPSDMIAETLSATTTSVKRILVDDFVFIAQMRPPPRSKLNGLEVLVAKRPPSEKVLRCMVDFFQLRKEAMGRGEIVGGVVGLHVAQGWPKFMTTRRDWVKRLEEVGARMVLTPYDG